MASTSASSTAPPSETVLGHHRASPNLPRRAVINNDGLWRGATTTCVSCCRSYRGRGCCISWSTGMLTAAGRHPQAWYAEVVREGSCERRPQAPE